MIINLKQVKVFERIRDLSVKDDKLYLFMENTASIGVINLRKFLAVKNSGVDMIAISSGLFSEEEVFDLKPLLKF